MFRYLASIASADASLRFGCLPSTDSQFARSAASSQFCRLLRKFELILNTHVSIYILTNIGIPV